MAVYRAGELESLWYGAYNPAGTNNTAELNALLQALMLAKTEIEADKTVQVRSDSSYGLNAVTKWAAGWKKRGWRKADGEIKNLEVIQELYALYQEIEDDVKLQHVSAHVGIEGNELADRMAMLAVERREVQWRRYEDDVGYRKIAEDARGLRQRGHCALRNGRKNSRMSSARASGCSMAAKWPPRANSVQRCTLKNRSAHSRGGCERSFGNIAKPAGTSCDPSFCLTASAIQRGGPAFSTSKYGMNARPMLPVTQYTIALVSISSSCKAGIQIAIAVAPALKFFREPRGESDRRIVESVGQRLRLAALDHGVGALLLLELLDVLHVFAFDGLQIDQAP